MDQCTGPRPWRDGWSAEQLTTAKAVAALALDGVAAVPEVAVTSYAPDTRFWAAWELATAARMLGSPAAAPLLDRALAEARAMGDYQGVRARVLLLVAVTLYEWGDAIAAGEIGGLVGDADRRHELSGHLVRLEAERGDIDAAVARLRAMPATWALFTDDDRRLLPSLGSAAAAACAALASPRVARSPGARALLEAAEERSDIDAAWRANRAWRALAMGWTRCGDVRRALDATRRIPGGSERADTIARVLVEAGGMLEPAKLPGIIEQALAAGDVRSDAPVARADTEQARRALIEFARGYETVAVALGAARAYFRAGVVDAGLRVVDIIPANYAARAEAEGHALCARARRGEDVAADLRARRPADDFLDRFFHGLAAGGCWPLARQIAMSMVMDPPWKVTRLVERLVDMGRVDEAINLFAAYPEQTPRERGDQLHVLITALSWTGRHADAAKLLLDVAGSHALSSRAVTWGLQLVSHLAAGGEASLAARLRGTLAPG